MTARLQAAALSDPGRVRQNDEDAFLVDEALGLFAVADGVGGHSAGEIASQLAVESLRASLQAALPEQDDSEADGPRLLAEAFRRADEEIRRRAADRPEYRGMATTLVVLLARGFGGPQGPPLREAGFGGPQGPPPLRGAGFGGLQGPPPHEGRPPAAWIAHAGDSRAYLARSGRLSRLTADHSALELFARENPEVDLAALKGSPIAHIVTRCLGRPESVQPDVRPLALEPGDRLLLCCDGLTDMISDEEIARLLDPGASPEESCRRLVEAANAAGGQDNITVVVLDVRGEDDRR